MVLFLRLENFKKGEVNEKMYHYWLWQGGFLGPPGSYAANVPGVTDKESLLEILNRLPEEQPLQE